MPFTAKTKTARVLRNLLLLTVGSLIYSVGVACFIDPNNFAPGGVTGLSILLNHLLPLGEIGGTGLYIFLLNAPLMIIGALRFKWSFFLSTLYSVALSSGAVELIEKLAGPPIYPATNNPLLAAMIGGALMALGMGLVFHGGGCTGGTDILVKLLRQRFKSIKSGKLFLITDLVIILTSMFVFNVESALYAVISVVVSSYVFDYVLYGPDGAMVVYIVSAKHHVIAQRLMREMDCGVTFLRGEGAYTGAERNVLMCAYHKHLYSRVRDVVQEEDPEAFMIITSAHEILGEGFKDPFADEL